MNISGLCQKAFPTFIFLFFSITALKGQTTTPPNIREDSLKNAISLAKTTATKIIPIIELAGYYMFSKNNRKCDSLIQKARQLTESEGTKKDQVDLFYRAGRLYVFSGYKDKGIEYLQQAYDLAMEENLKNQAISVLISFSMYYTFKEGNTAKAQIYLDKVDLDDEKVSDTTRFHFYSHQSDFFSAKKEGLLSFRSAFKAKKLALKIGGQQFINLSNLQIAFDYQAIKDYANAVKYYSALYDEYLKKHDAAGIAQAELRLGRTYRDWEKYDLAEEYFNRALLYYDSLKIGSGGYTIAYDLLQLYYSYKKEKFPETLRKYHMLEHEQRTGNYNTYNWLKGDSFSILNETDSAMHYYLLAAAMYDSTNDESGNINFSIQFANFLRSKKKDNVLALSYLQKALRINNTVNGMANYIDIYTELDSVYAATGDYKNAYQAKTRYLYYKDSLDKMNNRDGILKAQIADEEYSTKHAEEEDEKTIARRHNIQYTAIVVGGIVLLLTLLVLGFFSPPNWVIRLLGFVSFIFIFEFIILVLDTRIHKFTHGAPLPILLIKVLIACLLVPLHHLVEKKVIHFLQSKKLHRLKGLFKEPVK